MIRLTGTTWRELRGGGIHFAPAVAVTDSGYELGGALDIPRGKFCYVTRGTAPHNLEMVDVDGAWYSRALRQRATAIEVLLAELKARRQRRTPLQ